MSGEKWFEKPELARLVLTDLEDIQIGKKIGKGAYGQVYKGTLKVAAVLERKGLLAPGTNPKDEVVAIKELRAIVSSADEERFIREITTQATCKHPCILPLLAFSPVKTRPILVTKFVSGGSLEDILNDLLVKKKKPLGWTNTRLACCLYGVATALRDLHARGVIHRDVKPANVLLGQPAPQPLLCDFGQARSSDSLEKTQDAGSALFMAPDLIGSSDYTEKVDVYSFGIMVYVMTAGVQALPLSNGKLTPAVGDKVREQARQITGIEFTQHIMNGGRFERTPAIDDAWWELIQKCWDQKPEERPSFEDICKGITENADNFAMGRPDDAKAKQQFKKYVEDLEKKILAMK